MVLAAGAGIAFALSDESAKSDDPRVTVAAFLAAWQTGDTRTMARLVAAPTPVVAETYRRQSQAFGGWPGTRLIKLHQSDKTSTARFEATFRFKNRQTWAYRGLLSLAHTPKGWRVGWTPSTVHPLLSATTHFSTARMFAPRAAILAQDGTPLTVDAPVVTVGIQPSRMLNRDDTVRAVTDLLQLDPALIPSRLDAPGVLPDYFVEITTIPRTQYEAVKPELYPVPGALFRESTRREAATEQLGAHVVGRVGPITADALKELGPSYVAGDIVGLSGLERVYETRLAGTASHTIDLVNENGKTVNRLATIAAPAPKPVRTTLDLVTQRNAEAALGTTAPAAFVALRPSDGAVRAVVSTPTGEPFDRALDGTYPPGSTFKVVTGAALLEHGTTADTTATCPPAITVNGRTFRNFEGEAAANLPFSEAFAISCNTAFIGLAQPLPADALNTTATEFGFGVPPRLGLAAKGATFPTPKDDTERAAAAIGQARVTASPLAMAGVAATAAGGTWHPPTLVTDPSMPAPGASPPLATNVLDALRSLMNGVVQHGTGTAAAISGQPIGGKTGTAEFGTDTPPKTHAWFIGFRGDLAFAVLVEGGGVGGRVAAPIARSFLLAHAP